MVLIAPVVGAAAIAGLASYFGGRSSNKAARREAQRNRDFQERMSNTEHQRSMADMEAAGLNPALMYQRSGGASTPGGATAAQSDAVTPGVSSAMQMRQMQQTLKLTEEQIGKTKAERESAQAASRLATDRTNYLTARGTLRTPDGRTHTNVPLWTEMIDAEIASARNSATNLGATAARNRELAPIAKPMGDLSQEMGMLLPLLTGATGAAGVASRFLRKGRR